LYWGGIVFRDGQEGRNMAGIIFISTQEKSKVMKHIPAFFLIASFAVALLLCAGCSQAPEQQAETTVPTPVPTGISTPGELVEYVSDAAEYAREQGREKALAEFSKPDGQFVTGGTYVYAIDYNGIVLAHPIFPELVGVNRTENQDPNGVYYMQELLRVARDDGGFTYYLYPNPSHEGKTELKLSYVSPVDETYWIAAGIYLSDMPASFTTEDRSDLMDFVHEAGDYAGNVSRDVALAVFNDLEGNFTREDSYIFAYTYDGTLIAHPYQPELIGEDLSDLEDPNGVKILREKIARAQSGGGFAYYIYPNPSRNFTNELKLVYVEPVDDQWWLGSGIYASE